MNSCWNPDDSGWPEFFSGAITTYDNCIFDGFRTCSITQPSAANGYDRYNIRIPVRGIRSIQWGYMIRAIEVCEVLLQAEFYDDCDMQITALQADVADSIGINFSCQMAQFYVPPLADSVELSMHFLGKTTACTFYSPRAFYY